MFELKTVVLFFSEIKMKALVLIYNIISSKKKLFVILNYAKYLSTK